MTSERGPHDPIEAQTITVTLSQDQAAMVVYSLLEQAKQMTTPGQIEWSRLAIAINDLILEVPDEPAG
jgi:hypothetical protein